MKHHTEKNDKKPERLRENMSVHHTKKKKHKEKDKHKEHRSSHKEKHQSKHREGSKEKRSEKSSRKHKEHNSVSKKLSTVSYASVEESSLKSKNYSSSYKSASIESDTCVTLPSEEIVSIVNELVSKTHNLCTETPSTNHVSSENIPLSGNNNAEENSENMRHSPCPNSLLSIDTDVISKKRKHELIQYNGGNRVNNELLPCAKKLKFDYIGTNSHFKNQSASVSPELETSQSNCSSSTNFSTNHLKDRELGAFQPNSNPDHESSSSSKLAESSDKLCSKPETVTELSVPETQINTNDIAHCDIPRDNEISEALHSESPKETNKSGTFVDESVSSNYIAVSSICEMDTSSKSETSPSIENFVATNSASSSMKQNSENHSLKQESQTHQKNESTKSRPHSSEASATSKSSKHSTHKTTAGSVSNKIKTHSDKHRTKDRHNSDGKEKTKKSRHASSSEVSLSDCKMEMKPHVIVDKKSKAPKEEKQVTKSVNSISTDHKRDDCGHKNKSRSSGSGPKLGLCLRCRQKLTTHRNVSIQCKRDRHDKVQEKFGVSQRIPRLPQGMDMKHLKYGKYIRLEVYPNGGAALLHLYWDEICHMHRKELRCLAEEFLKVTLFI